MFWTKNMGKKICNVPHLNRAKNIEKKESWNPQNPGIHRIHRIHRIHGILESTVLLLIDIQLLVTRHIYMQTDLSNTY
jgi:hypothetical protein